MAAARIGGPPGVAVRVLASGRMARRRRIKGVLDSFLGTFVSRHSEYAGYWIFGMLVEHLDHEPIDLLGTTLEITDVGKLVPRA